MPERAQMTLALYLVGLITAKFRTPSSTPSRPLTEAGTSPNDGAGSDGRAPQERLRARRAPAYSGFAGEQTMNLSDCGMAGPGRCPALRLGGSQFQEDIFRRCTQPSCWR